MLKKRHTFIDLVIIVKNCNKTNVKLVKGYKILSLTLTVDIFVDISLKILIHVFCLKILTKRYNSDITPFYGKRESFAEDKENCEELSLIQMLNLNAKSN